MILGWHSPRWLGVIRPIGGALGHTRIVAVLGGEHAGRVDFARAGAVRREMEERLVLRGVCGSKSRNG